MLVHMFVLDGSLHTYEEEEQAESGPFLSGMALANT